MLDSTLTFNTNTKAGQFLQIRNAVCDEVPKNTNQAAAATMLSIFPFVIFVLVLSPSVAVTSAQTQGDSCGACNCQFNNVELLIDLIRAEINSIVSQRYGTFIITVH